MSRRNDRRSKIKVLIAMSVAVALAAGGDTLISSGVKQLAGAEGGPLAALALAITNFRIIGGVGMLVAFFLLYLASLSWADLSYVVPLTAGEYILVTLFGYIFLHENVTVVRWLGSGFVALGIALVTRT